VRDLLQLKPSGNSSAPTPVRTKGRHGGPGTQKACAGGGSDRASSTGRPGEIPAPDLVNEVISSPGQSLDNQTRTFFESRIGYDFGQVRVHTDEKAARSAGMVNALAYTVGKDVVFGSGQYNPATAGGKRLLAHELTHVMQQRGQESLQRTAGNGLMGGNALTTTWDIQFRLNKPAPAEMDASTAMVLTSSGLSSLNMIRGAFQMNQDLQTQLEGHASGEEAADHSYDLSVRRARYIARQIGMGRVRDIPGSEHTCPGVENGIYGCGSTDAHTPANPVDRRVQVALFTPPSATRSGVHAGGTPAGPTAQPGPAPTRGITGHSECRTPAFCGPNQWGISDGRSYLHHFLTSRGSSGPLNEYIIQEVASYTRQLHGDGSQGWELQIPVQFQVSLTTGIISVAVGVQMSYVLPLARDNTSEHRAHGQASVFGQALVGTPIANLAAPYSASLQLQGAVGGQIGWTPHKWFMLGGQGTVGVTWQTNGPTSIDVGGVIFVQVNTP
jgi:Domain of unknown function (DUF4157)